jgi:type I restriction enzyme S subunit
MVHDSTFTHLEELMAQRLASVDPSQHSSEVFELFSIPAYDTQSSDVVRGEFIGSAKKLVEPNDVLLSRIVPHIRRAWVVPRSNGNRQIASSEWIVFRNKKFHPSYMRHLLMSDVFHTQFMNTVAGVGGSLLRARPAFVGKIEVPLPPLPEQKRIAGILDKAETIRRKRQVAVESISQLVDAAFQDFFGDSILNGKGFPTGRLEQLVGRIVDCPHSTPTYSDTPSDFYCVRSSDIQDGRIDLTATRYVSRSTYEERIARHIPVEGEVVFTREGGRLGNAAQIPKATNICLGQRMMLFSERASLSTNEFIWALLNSRGTQHQVRSLVGGAAAPRINISDIRDFQVILPPHDLQVRFSMFIRQLRRHEERAGHAARNASDLFSVLVQRAFKGEL